MNLIVDIKEITVLERSYHTDDILIHTAFPGTMLGQDYIVFRVEMAKGKGAEYCRDVFGIEPRVIKA